MPKHGQELFFLVFNNDLERTQELRILGSQQEIGFVHMAFSGEVLAVYRVDITLLIKSNCHFQHQKKVVSGRADTPHHIGNGVGIG